MGSISTIYFNNILSILHDMGLPQSKILSVVNFNHINRQSPKERVDQEIVLRVLNFAEQQLNKPNIGLEVGVKYRIASFVQDGSVLAYCKTLAQAMEVIKKYQPLAETLGRTYLMRGQGNVFVSWIPDHDDPDKYRHLTELIMVGYSITTDWLSWRFPNGGKSIAFRHSAPNNLLVYDRVFNHSYSFNAPLNRFDFDPETVDRELPTSNPQKLIEMCGRLDIILENMSNPKKIKDYAVIQIRKTILDGTQSFEKTATLLGLGERSFRRYLKEDGLTYRELVDYTRQNMCKDFMLKGCSFVEIAEKLGYSDQSAFTRAFKKWYGVAPSHYTSQPIIF